MSEMSATRALVGRGKVCTLFVKEHGSSGTRQQRVGYVRSGRFGYLIRDLRKGPATWFVSAHGFP